jgi:hypothetical protein
MGVKLERGGILILTGPNLRVHTALSYTSTIITFIFPGLFITYSIAKNILRQKKYWGHVRNFPPRSYIYAEGGRESIGGIATTLLAARYGD